MLTGNRNVWTNKISTPFSQKNKGFCRNQIYKMYRIIDQSAMHLVRGDQSAFQHIKNS